MSGNKLKKSIGRIILKINSEILDLQKEYSKIKDGGCLGRKGESLEKTIKDRKEALEKALSELESRPEYVIDEGLEKTVQMLKDNIETAKLF